MHDAGCSNNEDMNFLENKIDKVPVVSGITDVDSNSTI